MTCPRDWRAAAGWETATGPAPGHAKPGRSDSQRAAGWCHDIFAAAGAGQSCARRAGSETMNESLFSFSATDYRAQQAAVIGCDELEADLRTIKWPGQAQGSGATVIAATRLS